AVGQRRRRAGHHRGPAGDRGGVVSAAQVQKLEALLARVQSRRLEPGLRLVDAAPADDLHVADSSEPDDLDVGLTARAPVAPVAAVPLLTLDEPVAAAPSAQRVTMDVDPDMDDLLEVDLSSVAADAPAPPVAELADQAEPEDALVTAVARPAPVAAATPVAAAAPVAAVAEVAPQPPVAPVAPPAPVAPVAVAPVAEAVPAPPSGVKSTAPVVMQA